MEHHELVKSVMTRSWTVLIGGGALRCRARAYQFLSYAGLSSSSFTAAAAGDTAASGQNRTGGGGRRQWTTGPMAEEGDEDVPTEGISRPLSQILRQLNKKVPDSVIKVRHEDGFPVKYIPWHIVNRIMNLHVPEWSGEVRSITYSADGKTVSVVYRVTLHGTDAELFRESTGTASVEDKGIGDPVQRAEAMAFRRACARFGLGLHLYHEDMS
ncbi:hypothetical protein Dimus_005950 [Dionaea muscipula]